MSKRTRRHPGTAKITQGGMGSLQLCPVSSARLSAGVQHNTNLAEANPVDCRTRCVRLPNFYVVHKTNVGLGSSLREAGSEIDGDIGVVQ